VVEELGRAIAPGPALPTVLAAALIAASTNEDARAALLPGLASGETPGAIGGGDGCGLWAEEVDGGLRVSGRVKAVLGANLAALIVAPASVGDGAAWVVLDAADIARE